MKKDYFQPQVSVEEFNKISDEMYDNNEIIQMAYEDEGDEPRIRDFPHPHQLRDL